MHSLTLHGKFHSFSCTCIFVNLKNCGRKHLPRWILPPLLYIFFSYNWKKMCLKLDTHIQLAQANWYPQPCCELTSGWMLCCLFNFSELSTKLINKTYWQILQALFWEKLGEEIWKETKKHYTPLFINVLWCAYEMFQSLAPCSPVFNTTPNCVIIRSLIQFQVQ
jgi:hypothetical protein